MDRVNPAAAPRLVHEATGDGGHDATGDGRVTEDPDTGHGEASADGPSPWDPAVSDPVGSLSLDAVLYVLANRSRRYVLYALADATEGVTDLATLVEEVATLEAARSEAAIRRDRYLEVARDLYHWHLPALADVGVVDFDGRHGAVRYRDHPTLSTWLDRVRRDELGG